MSIFGIIGISMLAGLMAGLISALICLCVDADDIIKPSCIIAVIVLVCGIFVGIGFVTESERVYIARYESQKQTIEQSLNSNVITGLERIELVNKAIELNGDLAEHKAKFNLWHTIYYDNSIYDNVDFIVFE